MSMPQENPNPSGLFPGGTMDLRVHKHANTVAAPEERQAKKRRGHLLQSQVYDLYRHLEQEGIGPWLDGTRMFTHHSAQLTKELGFVVSDKTLQKAVYHIFPEAKDARNVAKAERSARHNAGNSKIGGRVAILEGKVNGLEKAIAWLREEIGR